MSTAARETDGCNSGWLELPGRLPLLAQLMEARAARKGLNRASLHGEVLLSTRRGDSEDEDESTRLRELRSGDARKGSWVDSLC
mmetsp:Transcript_28153/g.65058  ORF Transcript_28153/g.65058 Transcript_28153/m.65058 type:complete len:84 (+) Transcript_28153:1095-1346(+)